MSASDDDARSETLRITVARAAIGSRTGDSEEDQESDQAMDFAAVERETRPTPRR